MNKAIILSEEETFILSKGETLESYDYFKEYKEKFPDKVMLIEMYIESINKNPTETTKLIKESLELLEKDYENWRLRQPVKYVVKNFKD